MVPAIDDAGTEYSGLTSIAEIKPEGIKMEKSFMENMEPNQVNRALIDTSADFTEKIGGKLIVKGVETHAQALTLRRTSDFLGNTGAYGTPVKIRSMGLSPLNTTLRLP